jgi:hypothetical protein
VFDPFETFVSLIRISAAKEAQIQELVDSHSRIIHDLQQKLLSKESLVDQLVAEKAVLTQDKLDLKAELDVVLVCLVTFPCFDHHDRPGKKRVKMLQCKRALRCLC